MEYSFVIEMDGAIVRVISPVFAADPADARRQAEDWLTLVPTATRLLVLHRGDVLSTVAGARH